MSFKSMIAAAVVALSASQLSAGQLTEIELAPIVHADAALTIVSLDGSETVYTPEMLEEFTTYSMTTTTPWREEPAEFAGILLSDLLAKHGLDTAPMIRVVAENNYDTTMERELLEEVPIMVATRVDGRAHSRRARGPIQFVIDSEMFASSSLTSESNLVWMAARIEAGN